VGQVGVGVQFFDIELGVVGGLSFVESSRQPSEKYLGYLWRDLPLLHLLSDVLFHEAATILKQVGFVVNLLVSWQEVHYFVHVFLWRKKVVVSCAS
jgi:hypothetical protein